MKKIAIVGTGIAGMSCGYYLKDACEVTFFEKDARPGGHTNTVLADEDGRPIPIDTGFIVYNEVTYPGLVKFFAELSIPTQETDMSFSFQHAASGLEYSGTGLDGLFAQRRNILNIPFWKMLGDINRFNKTCGEILDDPRFRNMSLKDYAKKKCFGEDFMNKYILPMSSAIWSTEAREMLDFPAETLVRFFKNHGLLGLTGHLKWRTVTGGSRVYRDRVMDFFKGNVFLSCGVHRVESFGDKVMVETVNGERREFDAVVLAAHADESVSMLKNPRPGERELLQKFRYQKNEALLHTDESVMPRKRRAWSAWNYYAGTRAAGKPFATTVYWMNRLQRVSEKKNYFVSINDPGLVRSSQILWSGTYLHPVYNPGAVAAQNELPQLNQGSRIKFCGSYFKYGFHEDAFQSGQEAAHAVLSL